MPNWVECKIFSSEPPKAVYVNLDLVVRITESERGSTIVFAGQSEHMVVSDSPAAILKHENVRRA